MSKKTGKKEDKLTKAEEKVLESANFSYPGNERDLVVLIANDSFILLKDNATNKVVSVERSFMDGTTYLKLQDRYSKRA